MLAFLSFLIGAVTQGVFLTLKLTGVVAWSWFWVTSPAWILCSILGLVLTGMATFAGIVLLCLFLFSK
jgi:hypothetical protein